MLRNRKAEQVNILNKTDLILLQKQTEKLGRDAFARINKTMAREEEETQIILNWCFASVQAMMQTMSFSQAKSLSRKVRDYLHSRKSSGLEFVDSGTMHATSVSDLEMIKSQDSIDQTMDNIRALVLDKTIESD